MFFILEILKKPVQTTRITQQQKIIISRLKKRQQHKKQQYFINKIIAILHVNESLDMEYSIKYVVVFWLRVRLQHLKAVHTRCNAVSGTGDSTGYCTINCAV